SRRSCREAPVTTALASVVQRGTMRVRRRIASLRAGRRGSRRSCPTTLKPVPALAREVCAACHFVTEDQMIDPEMGPWSVDAARHPATTAPSLRVFLQTPHARPHAKRGGDG
ncbi:MAG TPA: hypothetical protein VE597_00850, partial [Geminicoccaceae bacterium]|nr:hypothetical protein [Geminicoccaceae bacterium]